MPALSGPKRTQSTAQGVVINIDNSKNLASAATGTVVNYTVPAGKILYLDLVEFHGDNIAKYQVYKDADSIGRQNTWFSGKISGEFWFGGLVILAGEMLALEAENDRPDAADFHGRILGRLDDA